MDNPPNQIAFIKVTGHIAPSAPPIGAPQKVRFVVTILMIIERDIDGVLIKQVGANIIYESGIRHARETTELPRLVDGRDVMDAVGLPPGPEVGRVLGRLRKQQLAGRVTNRDDALRWLRTLRDRIG